MFRRALSSVVLAVGLAACGGPITAQETLEQTFTTGATPLVKVDTFNGQVHVTAGTGTEVKAVVEKQGSGFTHAEAEADLKDIEVVMQQEGNVLSLRARHLAHAGWNSEATLRLEVPAGALLDLKTSNGEVSTTGTTGELTVETSNGSVRAEGALTAIRVTTSNGTIDLHSQVPAHLEAKTSNGTIHYTGALAEGLSTFDTSQGNVTLALPSSSSFQLDASTSNGNINVDFPLTASQQKENHVVGTVGSSTETQLRVKSSNGSITVRPG